MSTLDTGAGYPHAGTGFRMQERWSEDSVAAGHAAVGWSRRYDSAAFDGERMLV